MADIAAVHLTTAIDDTGALTSTTASVSPTANRLVLAGFFGDTNDGTTPAAPTVAGNGGTWVLEDSVTASRRGFFLFRTLIASPSAGTIVATWGTTIRSHAWSVVEYSENDTSGTSGSGAVRQSVTGSTGTAGLSVTLAAFGDTANATAGFFGGAAGVSNTYTEGSGFTINGQATSAAEESSAASEFKATNDTGVDITWSGTTVRIFGIAVEIVNVTPASSGFIPRAMLI